MYQIQYKHSVYKDVRRIPKVYLRDIQAEIVKLADNPYPPSSIKMSEHSTYFRLRVGSYRVIYEVKEVIKIITIIKIGHRSHVYRSF